MSVPISLLWHPATVLYCVLVKWILSVCLSRSNIRTVVVWCDVITADLRKSDSGLYTCKATSDAGQSTWNAYLVVEASSNPRVVFHRTPEPAAFPGPPSKPEVLDVTETSVRLSWRANSNHGASPVVAFTVEYFSHETGQVRAVIDMLSVRFILVCWIQTQTQTQLYCNIYAAEQLNC